MSLKQDCTEEVGRICVHLARLLRRPRLVVRKAFETTRDWGFRLHAVAVSVKLLTFCLLMEGRKVEARSP